MGSTTGGGDDDASKFTFTMIIFAMLVMILLPSFITIYAPSSDTSIEQISGEVLDDYKEFTGTTPTQEAVWVLTGIYTPYYSGAYGYTDDGWLYSGRIDSYTPSQYKDDRATYTVTRDDDSIYRYTAATGYGDHEAGEIYTQVTMDAAQKSNIFFTTAGKNTMGEFFYYDYTGYRYSFQPLADYEGKSGDGRTVEVVANTTSLSLIWYDYYGSSGISGQLIITGSDSGVAYLTSQEIIRAYEATISTAKFNMTFNGLDMNVYVRIDPSKIADGYSITECWEQGYWSIMVTSLSSDSDAYLSADYSFNAGQVWDTIVKLFTFDLDSYGFSPMMSTVASVMFMLPLYAALLAIAVNGSLPILIGTGLLAAIQTIANLF